MKTCNSLTIFFMSHDEDDLFLFIPWVGSSFVVFESDMYWKTAKCYINMSKNFYIFMFIC